MRDPEVLIEEARAFYKAHQEELTAGDKEPLNPETRAALTARNDRKIAQVIAKYLPYLLPYCQSKLDVAASVVGLCYSGEIRGVPTEALPFLSRGLWIGVKYVFDDMVDSSDEVQELISSTNWRGYPSKKMKEKFFIGRNRKRQLKTCPNIASGTAILKVLSQNQDKVREIMNYDLTHEFDPICLGA